MSAQARDLYFVTEQSLAKLVQFASQLTLDWAGDWGVSVPDWSAKEAGLQEATHVWEPLAAGAWSQTSSAMVQRIAAKMVDAPSTKPLASDDWAVKAAQEAQVALLQVWADAVPKVGEFAGDTLQQVLSPMSGAVVLSSASLGVALLLSAPLVRHWAPTDNAQQKMSVAALTPLHQVLQQQVIGVQLGLGEVEITLADLQSLQAGDVVRFPPSLSSGLPLLISAGKAEPQPTRVYCAMGQMHGQLTIQVQSS